MQTNFLNRYPLPATINGVPGLYKWDDTRHKYVEQDASLVGAGSRVLATDVPVVVIIGAISATIGRIYSPMAYVAGNVWSLPDPFGSSLPTGPSQFERAHHFLKIVYANGSVEHALIGNPPSGSLKYR